jgi:anti-anti-sigma regulatory factor
MLRISTIDTRFQRKLILEGKLVEPWLGEFREVCRNAKEALEGRKLVIDLTDVTVIGCEAESALSELIQQGAKFSCEGVLIKHVIKQLARRCHGSRKDLRHPANSND